MTPTFDAQSLLSPAAYPEPVAGVRMVETHISWVFLAGSHAYKVKKPVDLGFLDFTTLERRRHFCEEELRINRRLCPALYDAVVPIGGDPTAPRIGETRNIFEFALRMKRFDEDLLWDRLARRGALLEGDVGRLAKVIARFHAEAPIASANTDFGTAAVFRASVERTAAVIAQHAPAGLGARSTRIVEWIKTEIERRSGRMDDRRAAGRVREVHGDLHLRNIALDDADSRAPLVFDAIEFDPRLRWIDVFNDIAFLTMDLDHRDLSPLGWRFLNAYLEQTGDYDGIDLWRLYAANRALVRAQVALLVQASPAGERRRESDTFLALAERTIGAANDVARLTITHGLSGSGKTRGSERLAAQEGALRVRSDVERKRLFASAGGRPPAADILYGSEATRRTYDRLREVARAALGAGVSVIVDASFLKRAERDAFRALAAETGRTFRILHFEADPETLRRRVAARGLAGGDASDATIAVLEHQMATQERLGADERGFVEDVPAES